MLNNNGYTWGDTPENLIKLTRNLKMNSLSKMLEPNEQLVHIKDPIEWIRFTQGNIVSSEQIKPFDVVVEGAEYDYFRARCMGVVVEGIVGSQTLTMNLFPYNLTRQDILEFGNINLKIEKFWEDEKQCGFSCNVHYATYSNKPIEDVYAVVSV